MDDAEYTVRFAKALLAGGQENLGTFVILTRTTSYCQKLRDLAEYELPNTEVHTVAGFQSRVADTVLFCADAAGLKEGECAWEEKRICQAMSAARKHLFILGHVKSLKVNKAWLDVNKDAGKRRKKDAILLGAGGELVSPERVLEKLKPGDKVKH
ncbi:hypothetical protein RvY_03162 [Ramazzottius varieornatus]|uniref:DNA2/NAM7 helicase-like C-terminal domain-containing protein n=1 Tax=Ramazzottius varieornatus TaxID=947166 RepID=A0A1D1UM57_RAMVA|nr:hypothetical protein RvY_03162 [Ramazzottius varieornatus]